MSILVDSSVWSLVLRRKEKSNHPAAILLRRRLDEKAGLCLTGVIYQEVLQGIRSDTLYQSVKSYLDDFEFLEVNLGLHAKAAGLFSRCRRSGIQAQTIDCLIATLSIHYDSPLLTTDPDFSHIARVSSLKLVDY
ncbi:MAG: PIN domain nuclease [Deltaproteobacteria bacterium]|nr:PIN domain nuclease [Deltaproteobacteria bacterium]